MALMLFLLGSCMGYVAYWLLHDRPHHCSMCGTHVRMYDSQLAMGPGRRLCLECLGGIMMNACRLQVSEEASQAEAE